MGKYLTEFSSNTAYNAALASLDYPNVSLVENQLKYAESLPTMYRWVDDGDNTRCGDDEEYDSCTLYQQTKKQKSVDGGQTWSDVIPREYGYGDVIEEDSQECGCGSMCRDIDLANEQGEHYLGELVQGIKFGWIEAQPGFDSTVHIWDARVRNDYIGMVKCVVDGVDASVKTVTIYDYFEDETYTINNYQEWSQWIRLCDYFSGRCMKLSTNSGDEDAYPSDGFPIIIKVDDSGENCDCGCLDE